MTFRAGKVAVRLICDFDFAVFPLLYDECYLSIIYEFTNEISYSVNHQLVATATM